MKKLLWNLFGLPSEEEIRKDERCKVLKELLDEEENFEYFVSIILENPNKNKWTHLVGIISSKTKKPIEDISKEFLDKEIEKNEELREDHLFSSMVLENFDY